MKSDKKEILVSFKKAQKLVLKIIEMIEQGRSSINIIQENLLAVSLLRESQRKLVENYIASCFNNGMISKKSEKKQEMTKEILKVTRLFNK